MPGLQSALLASLTFGDGVEPWRWGIGLPCLGSRAGLSSPEGASPQRGAKGATREAPTASSWLWGLSTLTEAGRVPQAAYSPLVPIPTNGSAIHPLAQLRAQEPLLILPCVPSPRALNSPGQVSGIPQHTAPAPCPLHPGHHESRVTSPLGSL